MTSLQWNVRAPEVGDNYYFRQHDGMEMLYGFQNLVNIRSEKR